MINCVGQKLSFTGGRLPVLAVLVTVSSFPQSPSPPPVAAEPRPVFPVVTASSFAFEVTTVKLNKSGNPGSGSTFNKGHFTATNVLLKNLMQYQAYGVPEPRILGGPPWINSQRFDIEAKTDSSLAEQLRSLDRDQRKLQMQRMFQQLLADRFKLATHWETRDLPVYALVVAKNGPSLHASKDSEGDSSTSTSTGQFTAKGVTLAELARALTQELSHELGRVVIDKTGVEGKYDVALKWTPDNGEAGMNSS